MPKLSSYPTVSAWDAADLMVGLPGAANGNATRATFLTASTGQACQMHQGGNRAGYSAAADYEVLVSASKSYYCSQAGNVFLQIAASTIVTLGYSGCYQLELYGSSASLILLHSGDISITAASTKTVTINGFAGSSSDWSGDPTDVWAAIYRIAAEVAILKGSPIS